jgi:hypothetical protein
MKRQERTKDLGHAKTRQGLLPHVGQDDFLLVNPNLRAFSPAEGTHASTCNFIFKLPPFAF